MRSIIQKIFRFKIIHLIYLNIFLPLLRQLPFPSTVFGPVKGRHSSFSIWLKDSQDKKHWQKCGKGHWIRENSPPQIIKENSPILAIPEVPKNFSLETIHKAPCTFVAHIKWGRLATKQCEVIAPDDRVFDDFFFSPLSKNSYPAKSLILPWLPRMKKKYGTYATFVNYRALVNYYHWVITCLTRLWVLDKCNINGYKLIVPNKLLPFQKQTLDVLGFSEDRLAPFGAEHWCVEHLLVPSYTMAAGHVLPEACRWLRDKLISSIQSVEKDLPKRIYISRNLTAKRHLINEEEIINFLEKFGFSVVRCETATIEQQINLFRQSEIVVSPHGAGLTNILFMNNKALVIELVPSRRAKPHLCNLASAMGIKYTCVTDALQKVEDEPKERQPDIDFSIPLERLSLLFKSLGI